MNPAAKLLWASFVAVAMACLVFLLSSCTTEKKVEAAKLSAGALSCRAKMSAIIQASPSCGVAAAAIRQIIKEDADCIEVFLGGGITTNCGDGGN